MPFSMSKRDRSDSLTELVASRLLKIGRSAESDDTSLSSMEGPIWLSRSGPGTCPDRVPDIDGYSSFGQSTGTQQKSTGTPRMPDRVKLGNNDSCTYVGVLGGTNPLPRSESSAPSLASSGVPS